MQFFVFIQLLWPAQADGGSGVPGCIWFQSPLPHKEAAGHLLPPTVSRPFKQSEWHRKTVAQRAGNARLSAVVTS